MAPKNDSHALLNQIIERQEELTKLSHSLEQLESQLSLVFAASPDLILFVDSDENIVKVSQSVKPILGYEREELYGKSVWDYIHEDDVESTRLSIDALYSHSGTHYYMDPKSYIVNHWRRKDGSWAKITWRYGMYDSVQNHSIGFGTDISNLVMENPFTFKFLHKAIDMTQDGVVITDNTTRDNPIIYVNRSFCEHTGYSVDELVGSNCRVLQSDDKEQKALQTLRDAIRDGTNCEVLLRNFRKNKTVFFNYLFVTPVIENGAVTSFIGISRDATELVDNGTYTWDRNSANGFGKWKASKRGL